MYSPAATGAPGELVHFTGTLTQSLPWSVTVTQPDGNIVGSGQGEGTDDRLDVGRADDSGREVPLRDRRGADRSSGDRHRHRHDVALDADRARQAGAVHAERRRQGRLDARSLSGARAGDRHGDARRLVRDSDHDALRRVEDHGVVRVSLGRDGDRGRALRDRADGAERDRDRDDRHAGRDRRSHDRRVPGLAAGLLAEQRRPAGHDALQLHARQARPGDAHDPPREARRSARSSRASSSLGSSRSTGTAASGAESASTSSGPTCGSPRRWRRSRAAWRSRPTRPVRS